MIKTIISKSPKKNSLYIYKQIEENLKKGTKSFLIVPEQYTLQSDINLIDHIDFTTIMDAKVLSFSSLSRFIIDRTGGLGLDILSKEGKLILITNILMDLNDELSLFKNNYKNIDFVNDMESLISNIKDNKFDEEFFKTIDTDLDDEVLKLKFRETKLIFDAYQKELADSYLDAEDRLNQVITRLSYCDFFKGAEFYFDKFDYVSDIKMDFIAELNRIGAHINVALTLDKTFINNPMAKDLEIYDMANKFYYNLRDIDEVKEIHLDVDVNPNEDINHLIKNYERFNPIAYQTNPSNIHAIESTSTKKEVENICLIINKLTAEKKARYRDMALYIPDRDEYENEISKVARRYRIPVFINRTNKLITNHIVKTYLAALRLVIYNFNSLDLNYFLRSNIFDFGETATDKIISFQNYIHTRNIKGNMFLEDKYFEMDRAFYENLYENDPERDAKIEKKVRDFEDINEIRNIILKLLRPLLDLKNNKAQTSQIVRLIYELFADNRFMAGINNYQNILLEEDDLDSYNENDQVWDKLMGILEELNALMDARENDLKTIYDLIAAAAADIEIGIIPPTKDHLIVTDFKTARIADRPINFALGLNDAFFPSRSQRDFLLAKDDKDKLKDAGIDLKIYEEDLEEREKLNLYKVFTVSDKLYFSYALSNRKNEAINKSIVLNGILNIFPALKIKSFVDNKNPDLIYSRDLTQKQVMDNLWKLRAGDDLTDEELDFTKTYNNYLKNYGEFNLITSGLFYTTNKNNLHLDTAKGLYPKNHFNITEIETYSKCPYRYFVNYGLKPEYEEIYDVDARELGTIVHNSLEDVSRLLKDRDIDNLSSENLDELITANFNNSIEKLLDQARREDPRNKFILNNLAKNTKNNSKEVINQLLKGEFKVADVEVDFGYGKDSDLPAVFVDDENYLRGRIDRIDSYDNYIRIIDYKTGKKLFKIVNILNGLDLQLLVYMMSANAAGGEIVPIGSFYMPLADELYKMNETYDKSSIENIYEDKFKMNGLLVKVNEEVFKLIDKEAFDLKNIGVIDTKNTDVLSLEDQKLVDDFAKKLVSSYIKDIKAGNIKLHPIRYSDTQNECQFCEFKGICKFDESIDSDKYRDFDKSKSIEDLKVSEDDNG